MDELSTVLGCSQMERIEEILEKREKVVVMYNCGHFKRHGVKSLFLTVNKEECGVRYEAVNGVRS